MYPPKSSRFAEFIEQLASQRPATSREDAVSLMTRVMNAVEDRHGLTRGDYTHRMNVFPLNLGWRNLDADPCYWDDSVTGTHRTQVFNNGRIVITRLKKPVDEVLDKPGV
jgi:hypothetical protein